MAEVDTKIRGLGLADTVASDGPTTGERVRQPDEADALLGKRLDHFVLEHPLGKGGMGAVYRAHDVSLDRPVAIKMIRGSLTAPAEQGRLLREARSQARLNHPNVVHIHYIGGRPSDSGEGAALFLAMELVVGETLDERLERGETMKPEEARKAMIQVARGLQAAHKAGIIHRDIKPSNLLMDTEGTVKIADFGLARSVDPTGSKSLAGNIVGSPWYMAPEQAAGAHVDHRADMYAMGATFYHLLTGTPVFEGGSSMEILARRMTEEAPSLPTRVPVALRRIIARLLAREADERYAEWSEVLEALHAASPERTARAGFWIRAAAVCIDTFIAAIWIALLGWLGMVVHVVHVTLGHAWRGQTLAKYLVRIRVTRPDGTRMGLMRSVGRVFAALWLPILAGALLMLSQGVGELREVIELIKPHQMVEVQNLAIAIGLSHGFLSLLYAAGLILAAFHPDKRALHDLLCDTVVSYKPVNESQK